MEITSLLSFLAVLLPLAYGAPTAATSSLHPEILAAMKRDLGLDAKQAEDRVARDAASVDIIEKLRSSVGEAFAGAWLTDDGKKINIAVTSEASADIVTKAGAYPVVKTNSLSKLQKAVEALGEVKVAFTSAESGHSGVASWYVDVISNKVVLTALAAGTATAEGMAKDAGLLESEFEVREVKELPTTLATVVGGDAYIINGNTRCSVGFSVNDGFVTAGHCGGQGSQTTTPSGEALGSVADSIFPGRDMGHVRTVGGTVLSPYIDGYGNYTPGVKGSNVAPIGASVCRSGSTSGLHCGNIQQFGVTVNYAQGAVTGMTQTNVCVEGGDSGGSYFSDNQAQGITSGGSGDCKVGGTSFFTPVNDILSQYGVGLIYES